MPLPLLAWVAVAAATTVVGAVAYSSSKDDDESSESLSYSREKAMEDERKKRDAQKKLDEFERLKIATETLVGVHYVGTQVFLEVSNELKYSTSVEDLKNILNKIKQVVPVKTNKLLLEKAKLNKKIEEMEQAVLFLHKVGKK